MVKWKRFTGGDFLFMEPKIHKRKNNHVVIVTSDAVDASVKQYRIGPWLMRVIVAVLCVIIGSLVGYLSYEQKIWEAATVRLAENKTQIASLEDENKSLKEEIASLNSKMEIMGETIHQVVAEEEEASAQLATYAIPRMLPLSNVTALEEVEEDGPKCIFTAPEGAFVVATANGTVLTLVEDTQQGYTLTIDHGNGYTTIYYSKAEPAVKTGNVVLKGQTLFVVGENSTTLEYKIAKDEVLIDPMELMEISG